MHTQKLDVACTLQFIGILASQGLMLCNSEALSVAHLWCHTNVQKAGTSEMCSTSFQITIKQARKSPIVHEHNDYSFASK